jgi:hypothetical protein
MTDYRDTGHGAAHHYEQKRDHTEAARTDRTTGDDHGPWSGSGPELAVAGVAVTVAAVTGYAMASWAGLGIVAVVAGLIALAVLRGLLPQAIADVARLAREKRTARPVSGYGHRRFVVASGVSSRSFYDLELRPVLEHLLAARLAERHGINLYQDPAAARRVLCKNRRDAVLWQWIDPSATAPVQGNRRGIPRYVLARLIERLEHL